MRALLQRLRAWLGRADWPGGWGFDADQWERKRMAQLGRPGLVLFGQEVRGRIPTRAELRAFHEVLRSVPNTDAGLVQAVDAFATLTALPADQLRALGPAELSLTLALVLEQIAAALDVLDPPARPWWAWWRRRPAPVAMTMTSPDAVPTPKPPRHSSTKPVSW